MRAIEKCNVGEAIGEKWNIEIPGICAVGSIIGGSIHKELSVACSCHES
jgi:hypothetical protein